MGREHRIEDRLGRTESRVQPAFVLVGAPGTNKRKIANTLAADHFTEQLSVQNETFVTGAALGMFADYRIELKIAADRATRLQSVERPTLYTHSLIDSLAYTLARVDTQFGNEVPREEWLLTMGVIGDMLRDSFKADEIFVLQAEFDPEENFDQAIIQEIQGDILDGFELSYHVLDLDAEGVIDNISTVIAGYIDSRSDTSEPA